MKAEEAKLTEATDELPEPIPFDWLQHAPSLLRTRRQTSCSDNDVQ